MSFLRRIYNYYIRGDYHCDKCPYGWEDRGYDDADAGCYIKGDLDDYCRMLPIWRHLCGYFKKKKIRYWNGHQYDDIYEYVQREESAQKMFDEMLDEMLSTVDMYRYTKDKYDQTDVWVIHKQDLIDNYSSKIRLEYDEKIHPVIHKRLRTKWKDLLIETGKSILLWFRVYLGRSE